MASDLAESGMKDIIIGGRQGEIDKESGRGGGVENG